MGTFTVRRVKPEDKPEWLRMRLLLWPHHTPDELQAEMDQFLADPGEQPVFILLRAAGAPGGFLEGGTRKYADGCETGPVGYIEGWYVDEDLRRQGGRPGTGARHGGLGAWARAG